MPSYSVATTKDKLSSLIDKALAGEEVIITRHGRPAVALVTAQAACPNDVRAATARLQGRLHGEVPLNLPTSYFREWLYQDDAY